MDVIIAHPHTLLTYIPLNHLKTFLFMVLASLLESFLWIAEALLSAHRCKQMLQKVDTLQGQPSKRIGDQIC